VHVIDVHYLAPLTEIDEHLDEHVTWLDQHYASGRFVASGRKEPRTGGIILALGDSRAELEFICSEDPFARQNLATHTVTEFQASRLGGPLDQDDIRVALTDWAAP
jgi:uncharacterized protein YciI